MDTFMENLAQRLSAQEMIKANTAAEAEELNNLKVQVKDYHECLEQMQNLINESTEQIRTLQNDGNEESKRTQEEIELLFEAVNAAGEKNSEQNIQTMEEIKRFVGEKFDAFAMAENPDDALKRQLEIESILAAVSAAESATSRNREAIEELKQFVDEKTAQSNVQTIEVLKQFVDEKTEQSNVQTIEELKQFVDEKTVQTNARAMEELRQFMAEKLDALKPQENAEEDDRLQEELSRLFHAVHANSERTIQQNDAAFGELKQFVDNKFAESKSDTESIEQLKYFIEGKMQSLQQDKGDSEKLEASLTGKFEETQEKMHKECVKVYRNVQAAMQEENEKQNTDLSKQMDAMKKKMSLVTAAAAIAGLVGVASLVLQILSVMHII